ncbi:hypothetical protein SAMN05518855_100546 [Paenibacillus sp. CF384]|nr:hypothetical protein SAMN05518855_100546 [Paenibacillus sp. CF384]
MQIILKGWIHGEFLELAKCKAELYEYNVGSEDLPNYWYSPIPLDVSSPEQIC